MSALHPEALNAAYAAFHAHAADPGRKGSGVEKAIAAYLEVAHAAAAPSPEEQSRVTAADGKVWVTVSVEKRRAFAWALLAEWKLFDGVDRTEWSKRKAINIPATFYDAILDRVRLRLRPGGLDE